MPVLLLPSRLLTLQLNQTWYGNEDTGLGTDY